MKTLFTFLLCILLTASLSVNAQDNKTKKATVKTSSAVADDASKANSAAEKEQKAWMDYMTPGSMHQMMKSSDGVWHEYITFWAAPGAPATTMEAECTNSMVLGDRYQESVHTGTMMGMPFEGKGTCGYDNAKKMFQSTWVDNMGSGIMFLEGKYDEASKSITLKGKTVDPATGKTESVREILKFIDNNTQMMEMYMTKDGKEFKSMEIKLSRKSADSSTPK